MCKLCILFITFLSLIYSGSMTMANEQYNIKTNNRAPYLTLNWIQGLTDIRSESVTLSKDGSIFFQNDVFFDNDKYRLKSNTLKIKFNDYNVPHFYAEGNIDMILKEQDIEIFSKYMNYSDDLINLSSDVHMQYYGLVIKSQNLEYRITEDDIIIEGNVSITRNSNAVDT